MRSIRVMTLLAGLLSALFATSSAAPVAIRAADPHSIPEPGSQVRHPALDAAKLVLTPGPGGLRIPIDVRGNHIYMRGRLNDSDSLWIVLDTGASGNVINTSVADQLQLVRTGAGHAQGAGGAVATSMVMDATVRLPGVTLEGAPLAAIALDAIAIQSGRAMDAIVGYPLLNRCVVRIDYAAGVLTIFDRDGFRYSGQGTVIPLSFEHQLPYITARVTLPGRAPVEGRFVIDTGSSQALILTAPFVREQRALEAVPRTIQGRGRGVGGQVQSPIGRLGSLELGGLRIDAPIATLRVSDVGVISAAGTAGNIGGDILRRFTVILDYPHQRMILEPNQRFREPLEADMSGLGLRMGPTDSRALQVEWLQPGSPALEAGVQPDDLIESVDGRPAIEIGIVGLREMFRHEGETHRLTLRRGETRFEITLTTRRLI